MKNVNNGSNDQNSAVQQVIQPDALPLSWKVNETAPDAVKQFLHQFYPNGLVCLNNTFLTYSDGYWKKLHNQADVMKSIAKFYMAEATSSKVRELFKMLELTCVVRVEDFKSNTNYICFLNGALDMTSYKLVPHNPNLHLQFGRSVDWDESAKAPVFTKYLNDIFRDDEDRDEKVQFVLEWIGLCLVPDTSFEKFVVCVGDGGNGKSVLLKLMAELLGHENIYSAPIQRLGNRRALAELDGKLLLTSSEINENTVMDDGILKQLVSGDTVEAGRVYERPFTFTPYARIMLATNHLPKLRDVTNAFFRRLVLLRFNRDFTADGEIDMQLSAKLKGELSGIFAMAVDGLRTLRKRGKFVVPKSSEDAASIYREDSDPIKLFTDEALERTNCDGMRPGALYKLYTSWCRAYGHKPTNNITLGKSLRKIGIEKQRSNGKDYWWVKMTPAGEEISVKQFARVEEVKPEGKAPYSQMPETASNVVPIAVNAAQTEEAIAA
jgi:putative DNA primase/helicase